MVQGALSLEPAPGRIGSNSPQSRSPTGHPPHSTEPASCLADHAPFAAEPYLFSVELPQFQAISTNYFPNPALNRPNPSQIWSSTPNSWSDPSHCSNRRGLAMYSNTSLGRSRANRTSGQVWSTSAPMGPIRLCPKQGRSIFQSNLMRPSSFARISPISPNIGRISPGFDS